VKRSIAVAVSSLCAIALLGVAASPAPAAAPPGTGLEDFGTFTCEGFGDVTVFGPSGPKAAASFTTAGQTTVLLSLSITATDPEGNPFEFSKTYGQKSGLTAITCTQHFDEGGFSGDVIAVVGLVPTQ
jgi:hypothetical protein